MRRGRVFKRCSKCGGRVPERRCQPCGSETFSWAYVVDVAPAGAVKREQRSKAGFPTKAAALTAMNELQAAKAAGTYVSPLKLTLAGYLTGWLPGVRCRESTRTGYEVCIRRHIVPRLGAVPIQQLTRVQVRAFLEELRTAERVRGAGPLSPKSVHNVAICLRAALTDAVEDGLLIRNPAERTSSAPSDGTEMLTWSREQLRTFLTAVADDHDYALWRLLATTGLRRGEALGLRWRDVDVEAGRLAIQQQLTRAGDRIVFGPPKTAAGRRSISVDPGTIAALRAHRVFQLEHERMPLGEAYSDGDLVFCRVDGRPHDPDVISHRFESLARRAGVSRIRLHDLRHTAATLLLQAGVHPKIVQERLGHSSVMITLDRYSHITPNLQDEAAAKIGILIG